MSYTPVWVDWIQQKLSIPIDWIKPLLSIQWGWGTVDNPNWRNVRVKLQDDTDSLYMNGAFFFGIQTPFFINIMIRWGGATASPAYVQAHAGWRPIDGAPVIVVRFQSDESAQGGLASGWADGPK